MLSRMTSASVSDPCSEWVREPRPSLSKKDVMGYAKGGIAVSRLGVSGGSSILSANVSGAGASEMQSDRVGDLCMSADGTRRGDAGSGVTRGVGDEIIGTGVLRNSWSGVVVILIQRMIMVQVHGVGSL